MKNISIYLKVLVLIFFVNNLFCQNSPSGSKSMSTNTSEKSELSEDDKKLKKIIEDVNQKNNAKTESTIYGTNGSSFDESGVNFKNYNGRDYTEVAKAKNWNPYAVPENMEEQYDEYYQEKKIKSIVLISLLIILIISTLIFFLRKPKKNNINISEDNLKEKIKQINIAYENGVLTKDEFDNKIKNLTK